MDLDDEEYRATRRLNGLDKDKCYRCGNGKPHYCEECFQKLIAENMRLKQMLEEKNSKEV